MVLERMEKIKWSEKVTNEQVLELLNEVNWIGHILKRNCLLYDAIEGEMMELKGVGRLRTQILEDLRNRRRYWELKEEAEDQSRWKRQFIN